MMLESFSFDDSKLEEYNILGSKLNINLFVKRDDLSQILGGGNKFRKLCFILRKAQKEEYNAIVTAGGLNSNHARATAIMAAKLGWRCILIIHADKPEGLNFKGNLKLASLCGAELRFTEMETVSDEMDRAMTDLVELGYKPYYIWGGGHSLEGTYAYYNAIDRLQKDLNVANKPNYIFLASGTGATQAGVEIGIRQFYPECKVIGVSVARKSNRGKIAILESMAELNSFLGFPIKLPSDIEFDDSWIGDGYESTYPELLDTIRWAASTEGLILDPTYTGKAFHALKMYVNNGTIPSSANVVFWHTGGLLNLMASNQI